MKKNKSVIAGYITVSIVIMVLTAVLLNGCAKESTEVKIGYMPITLSLPFFVAMDKDYFTNEGLKIAPVKFATANAMGEALMSKQIDAVTGLSLQVLYTIEQNAPKNFRVFAVQANTKKKYIDYILVKKNSQIKDISELKGKKIGTFPGSTILTYTKVIFRKLGFNPEEDIQIVQLPPQVRIPLKSATNSRAFRPPVPD